MCRTLNKNLGAQCRHPRLPGTDVCYLHANPRKQKYGRVDGPIPELQLRQFLRAEEKSYLKAGRQKQEGGEDTKEESSRGRADMQWYTRVSNGTRG